MSASLENTTPAALFPVGWILPLPAPAAGAPESSRIYPDSGDEASGGLGVRAD